MGGDEAASGRPAGGGWRAGFRVGPRRSERVADEVCRWLPRTPEIPYLSGMINRPPDPCREDLLLIDATCRVSQQASPRSLRDYLSEDQELGLLAAHVQAEAGDTALLEVGEADVEWEAGQFSVKGALARSMTIQDCAFATYTNLPKGPESGMEATNYYDPPNLTFPVRDVHLRGGHRPGHRQGDRAAVHGHGQFGGNVHGLCGADGGGDACVGDRAHGDAVFASPAGGEGDGEVGDGGMPPAIANAVVVALAHMGVTHMEIPTRPDQVWEVLREKGVVG